MRLATSLINSGSTPGAVNYGSSGKFGGVKPAGIASSTRSSDEFGDAFFGLGRSIAS
jgi:hypothetical protein